jgi:hypothetical protein
VVVGGDRAQVANGTRCSSLPASLPPFRSHLITTITSFATASDVTLAELQLEAFLPADEATAEVLRRRWG